MTGEPPTADRPKNDWNVVANVTVPSTPSDCCRKVRRGVRATLSTLYTAYIRKG